MDFLHNSLQLIEQYMLAYGYWAVFFGVMLENAGLPIPGETILLVAGYFASTGVFQVPLVMLTAATGAVIGDNIGFAIGHHYGRGFLLRICRFFFLTPKRFEHMENYFASHGNKTILVARFITGLRVFAALLAGASRKMPWRVFLTYNLAGAMISLLLSPAGDTRDLVAEIQRNETKVITWPPISITPPEDCAALDDAIENLFGYDWLLLKNANAARCFLSRFTKLNHSSHELD